MLSVYPDVMENYHKRFDKAKYQPVVVQLIQKLYTGIIRRSKVGQKINDFWNKWNNSRHKKEDIYRQWLQWGNADAKKVTWQKGTR